MNKREIKKIIKEKPSEELVKKTALKIAEQTEDNDLLDQIATMRPDIARAVSMTLTGGFKRAEIANLLGVTTATVGKWLRKPEIKQYIEERQREDAVMTQARIKAVSNAALEKMVELMESPIDGIALAAARDILDRAGHKPKQEVKKEVTVKTFEQKLTDLIGEESIDVDYEELPEVAEDE